MHKKLLLLYITLACAFCLSNPGSLITIPFPLSPPQLNLNLPIKIDPILINQLQLSQINLKAISYTWEFSQKQVVIKISQARILFQWNYKMDHGQGVFTESSYDLTFGYQFVKNNKNRIQLNVTSTKSKIGKTTIHLGGNAKQTVVIIVTDLILNNAAITFRKIIENAIKKQVQSFSNILDIDIKIYCSKGSAQVDINNQESAQNDIESSRCLYINTTLVAPPIVSNKFLTIQLNGAPYLTGQSSGELNPQSVLIKQNSPKIQLQMHKRLLTQMLAKVLKLLPGSLTIQVSKISTVVDINSLTLSPLFPAMSHFSYIRQVLLTLSTPAMILTLDSSSQKVHISGNTTLQVLTQQTDQSPQVYIRQAKIAFVTDLALVFGWKSASARISSLDITDLTFDNKDIDDGLVSPDTFQHVKNALLSFLRAGINGSLNQKLIELAFNNIQAVATGKLYNDHIKLDLSLNSMTELSFKPTLPLIRLSQL